MQFRYHPNLFFLSFFLTRFWGEAIERRKCSRDLNHSSSYSIIFGKNWLNFHVLTFISITTTKLHTVHQWKVITLYRQRNSNKSLRSFFFWLLGNKTINIYKFSRAHFFFLFFVFFCWTHFIFLSTERPERKRHLDCLLVWRRKREININEVVINVAVHAAASFKHHIWHGNGWLNNGDLNDAIRTAVRRFVALTEHSRLATGFNHNHQSDEHHETQQDQQHTWVRPHNIVTKWSRDIWKINNSKPFKCTYSSLLVKSSSSGDEWSETCVHRYEWSFLAGKGKRVRCPMQTVNILNIELIKNQHVIKRGTVYLRRLLSAEHDYDMPANCCWHSVKCSDRQLVCNCRWTSSEGTTGVWNLFLRVMAEVFVSPLVNSSHVYRFMSI